MTRPIIYPVIDQDSLFPCPTCSTNKPLSSFPVDGRHRYGHNLHRCVDCLNAFLYHQYENDPIYRDKVSARATGRAYKNIHLSGQIRKDPELRQKRNEKDKRYFQKHHADPEWRKNKNAKMMKSYYRHKVKNLAAKYGVSPGQIQKDLDACNGKCPILKLPFPQCGGWCVDHCHGTSVYRGIISAHANLAIGYLHNSMNAALKLAKHLERNTLFSSASSIGDQLLPQTTE